MSPPLLVLALDRTPLLLLQLMNGALPLLLVLQVSNLFTILRNNVYQPHLLCHINPHDQDVLFVALHFCWLYKCQRQAFYTSMSVHCGMLTSPTDADGWDAAPAPQAQQAQFGNADQFGAQY
jgi:hypothetical protein